ncbi:iron-sulfur cluster assembly protein [Lactobacillus sp. HT06-2]
MICGINLVDLGLIYQIAVQDETATITMTLPVACSALTKEKRTI